MTQIKLPYGKQYLNVDVPDQNLLVVVSPQDVEPVSDTTAEVKQALERPVGLTPPLGSSIQSGHKVVLIVDDVTRPTPAGQVLPPLVEALRLEERGAQVSILVAVGTHRPMTEDELVAKVGKDMMERFPVVQHNDHDPDNLVNVGRSANGTPLVINRQVVEADFVVAIGSIVPHCLAGWAGGAKLLQPGVGGRDTTSWTHRLAAVTPVPNLGRLDNPVRNEIEQITKKVRLDLIVNTVLDRYGQIVHVVAGEPTAAHRHGVELARPIWEVPVPALADIVIVSSYPADIDFWQAAKGLFTAELVVKRGGDIILATPCPERLSGTPDHVQTIHALKGMPSRELFQESERQGLDDLVAVGVSMVVARVNELAWVQTVSDGLTEDDLEVLGHASATNIDGALRTALDRQGKDARVMVITHGGEVYPVVRPT